MTEKLPKWKQNVHYLNANGEQVSAIGVGIYRSNIPKEYRTVDSDKYYAWRDGKDIHLVPHSAVVKVVLYIDPKENDD